MTTTAAGKSCWFLVLIVPCIMAGKNEELPTINPWKNIDPE